MKVYLGGPINGCTDEEANGWRSLVKQVLDEAGWAWIDPMDRDYRGRELDPGIAAEIVELDKEDIDACDVLLMNCPKPSYGTAMEILYGWGRGKPVLVTLPEGSTPSPWIVYHATAVYFGAASDAATDLVTA